jgi:hypothetical protein
MNHTRWVQLFIRLLPFGSGLSSRLRRHLERCPECLGRMADVREARAATVSKNDLGRLEDYWPRLALGLQHPEKREHSGLKLSWAWALGAAGLMALAIIGLFFRVPPPNEEPLSSGVKLRINYVRMYEQPAQAFIFHTQDANSTFVWVEKQKSGEVL